MYVTHVKGSIQPAVVCREDVDLCIDAKTQLILEINQAIFVHNISTHIYTHLTQVRLETVKTVPENKSDRCNIDKTNPIYLYCLNIKSSYMRATIKVS